MQDHRRSPQRRSRGADAGRQPWGAANCNPGPLRASHRWRSRRGRAAGHGCGQRTMLSPAAADFVYEKQAVFIAHGTYEIFSVVFSVVHSLPSSATCGPVPMRSESQDHRNFFRAWGVIGLQASWVGSCSVPHRFMARRMPAPGFASIRCGAGVTLRRDQMRRLCTAATDHVPVAVAIRVVLPSQQHPPRDSPLWYRVDLHERPFDRKQPTLSAHDAA